MDEDAPQPREVIAPAVVDELLSRHPDLQRVDDRTVWIPGHHYMLQFFLLEDQHPGELLVAYIPRNPKPHEGGGYTGSELAADLDEQLDRLIERERRDGPSADPDGEGDDTPA